MNSKIRILITGGTGFIGSELFKELIVDNEIIVASANKPEGEIVKYWKQMDILSEETIKKFVEKMDLIYHLAAYGIPPHEGEKDLQRLYLTNVLGTLNMTKTCFELDKRMVFASTYSAEYLDSNYAVTKKAGELIIQHYVKKGLNASIIRLPSLIGPKQKEGFVVPDLLKKLKENPNYLKLKGSGKEEKNFLYIEDAVSALMLVGKAGKSGNIYEVGSDKNVKIYKLARMICEILKVNPKIEVERESRVSIPYKIDNRLIKKLGWEQKWSLREGLIKSIN